MLREFKEIVSENLLFDHGGDNRWMWEFSYKSFGAAYEKALVFLVADQPFEHDEVSL